MQGKGQKAKVKRQRSKGKVTGAVRLLVLGSWLLAFGFSSAHAWGGWSHKRMTYWAWKWARLPASSGQTTVRVAWNLDTLHNVLGFNSANTFSLFTYAFVKVSGADFNIDTSPISKSDHDSLIFMAWGRAPDDFDQPAAALGGALWNHMYIPAGGGFADAMVKYYFNKAVASFSGNRRRSYCYLAMACHYLEDCGFPPHNEKNYLDGSALLWQKTYHHDIEDKIGGDAFWFSYMDTLCARLARRPLPAFDPVAAVHSVAWETAWLDQEFKAAAKSGNDQRLVAITRKCIIGVMPRVAGLFHAFKLKVGLQ